MSDARWTEVDKDIDNALMHFDLAVRIFQTGEFDSSDILESYKSSSGLMHGMDAGYTSIENAIQRILRILGETPPSEGKSWHKDLIARVTTPMKGSNARPAFFDRDLRDDLLECMKMRHLVRHRDYGEFDPGKAGPSVDAARRIVLADATLHFPVG